MKEHLRNAFYGVLDYAVVPVGMLLVAPIVLHRLGADRYGIWALATSATSVGGIVASGFGDANIQRVSTHLEMGHRHALVGVVRNTLTIHLLLGVLTAMAGLLLAGPATKRFTTSVPGLAFECALALQAAALLMLVRSLESVCISTQRAHQRYGSGLRISIACRVLSLGAAGALSLGGMSVAAIMAATLFITTAGTVWQFIELSRLLEIPMVTPAFDAETFQDLFHFGIFSWLQAVAVVVFAQVDRIFLGLSLGVQMVAAYTLCLQMTQPLLGAAAAGLHFLFPYLAARAAASQSPAKPIGIAALANAAVVAAGALLLLLFGGQILASWASPEIAAASGHILPLIVVSTALTGMGVTATYALLALGRVPVVTWFTLGGGAVMLCLMSYLLPRYGVEGLASARLAFGVASVLLYLPLLSLIRSGVPRGAMRQQVCEEA